MIQRYEDKTPTTIPKESLEDIVAKAKRLREESERLHKRQRKETSAEKQARHIHELEEREQRAYTDLGTKRRETEARRNLRETHNELFKARVENIKERIQPSPAVKGAFEIANKGAEIAISKLGRGTTKTARATGKGLVRTGKFLKNWSESMPEVKGPTPTGIFPSKTYVLTGKDRYDSMYKDLEDIFADRSFTMAQAIEALVAMGWNKLSAQAKVSSFINSGSMTSEPVVPKVGRVDILPKVEIPETKSMNSEIFGVDKQYF
jgi:hypothetical protein